MIDRSIALTTVEGLERVVEVVYSCSYFVDTSRLVSTPVSASMSLDVAYGYACVHLLDTNVDSRRDRVSSNCEQLFMSPIAANEETP